MAAQPNATMSVEEYLAFDRASETKHEYYDGEILAMAGASFAHNLIVGNTYTSLRGQLRGGNCRVILSDLRLFVQGTGLFAYPDLTVVCGQPRFGLGSPDILLNPTLIVEVLSSSTESHDRGKKFQQYRTIESLRGYLLIAQDTPRIEHFARQTSDLWLFSEAVGMEATLHLPSIDCELTLADIYQEVELASE